MKLHQIDLFTCKEPSERDSSVPDDGSCYIGNRIHPRHAWGRVAGAWVCARCGAPMPNPVKILMDTVRGNTPVIPPPAR